MKVTLERSQIELAISLGTATLARYIRAYGLYNNTFNSHIKGRFGEIALEALFEAKGCKVTSNFRNPNFDRLCDLEVVPATYRRLEAKTWSADHWDDLGRCISVSQVSKLRKSADAVVWCTVPLPNLGQPSDLDTYSTLDVTLLGYSLPADLEDSPIRFTGPKNRRQVENYQVDPVMIRPIEDIVK